MEVDPSLIEVWSGDKGDAPVGDYAVEVLEGRDVLVGERLVEHGPETFGGLELRAVRWQVDEPNAVGNMQAGSGVPAGVVENQDDDPLSAGAGLLRKGGQKLLEEWLGDPVGDVPEHLARARLDEGGYVEPLEAVISRSTRPIADRCPDTTDNRLQSNAMLIAGEDFNDLIRMLRCFFLDSNRELFLNSSCSCGVARSGCSGRGLWSDQPIARRASQPR